MLKFKLNVAERKTLAKRMEELTGIHPYYTKAPLYSYDIGSYTIDRNGNLLVEPENADAELLTTLLNEGLIRGGESIESTDDQMENTEPTDHLEEDPVTEDTEAETEVLDEQESEDESTTEGNEPAEAESEEASEPDNAAEDEPDAEEPESEEQSEAEDHWTWSLHSRSASTMVSLSATWSTFFTAAASSSARRLADTFMWKRGWSRS